MSLLLAHLRHGAMSDLSPLCEQKRKSLSGFRHRSRASFRRPQCGSFRSRLNTRLTRRLSALMTPRQHRRAAARRDKDQGFHRHLPFCGLMLGSRKLQAGTDLGKKRPPQPGGATAKGLEEENCPSEVPGRNFTCTFWASGRPSGFTFRRGRRWTTSC
jgi:hypothetical protein